ncbi:MULTISPECIES: LysE family translocator [unclassified Agarivorans]|uniref:LysE family translocator n=1 Tax=unclassified Agarivorans TaxID=2636026 RepID=UPI003D7CD6F6
MLGITDFWLFVGSGILLNMLPGPDSLYVVARASSQGLKAGSVAALGIGCGTFVHIFAAAFGLSAILASSATAFTLIKILGCLYLLLMGLTMIFTKANIVTKECALPDSGYLKIFRMGFLSNSLNPKVALFFLAFVPQFIASNADNKALAFLVLGLVFNLNGMIWCHLLAWCSVVIRDKVGVSDQFRDWLNRCLGGLFMWFGIRLALAKIS